MWFLLFTVILLLLLLFYRRARTMSILKRCGIPGPEPNILLGNTPEMRNITSVDYHNKLVKKYGKIVGFYNGAQPTILVADTDLIQKIQTNDFKYFIDRPKIDIGMVVYEKQHDGNMLKSRGERWKQIRQLASPSFSTAKLKTLIPTMEESVDTFVDIVGRNAKTGAEFNIYQLAQRLTAEVITRTAFGIENKIQIDSEVFEETKKFIHLQTNTYLYSFTNCFPWAFPLILRIMRLNIFNNRNIIKLFNNISQMVKQRKENPNFRKNDVLQALMDATIDTEEQNDTKFSKGMASTNLMRLSEAEIKANAFIIFLGGYDSTSFIISCISHNLIHFPDIQERARREVQEFYKTHGKLDINEMLGGLPFLECVIKETLRLYPITVKVVGREASQDYKYKNMTIPKGATILVPAYVIHYDPDYWPNPELFDPTRHSAERKHEYIPFSFQSFGDGPRSCIGMRFALFELKLVFAKLLLRYRIEKGPHTEVGKVSTDVERAIIAPINGVYVKVAEI